jgi:bifunctional DNA-binding transcriptional regulator/antitoxin component of YhaV-PrlF toxin-antitoxin module
MLENTFNDTIQNTDSIVTLDEDENGDLVVPVPDDIMTELGWQDGDLLEWDIEDDHIVLRRVEEDENSL